MSHSAGTTVPSLWDNCPKLMGQLSQRYGTFLGIEEIEEGDQGISLHCQRLASRGHLFVSRNKFPMRVEEGSQ